MTADRPLTADTMTQTPDATVGPSQPTPLSPVPSPLSSVSSSLVYFALVLLLGVIIIGPLLQPGYFWGAHDARHDVYFIFEYDQSVQDGIWFPRWGPDWAFGYGYPFWIVYGPLATFLGELFHHFLGLGFEASVKAVLGLSILASGLAMYGFVRSWLGRNAGLVAAVAYMAIPYHLVDTYVRAAMAESVALVFLPLALWAFREAVIRPRLRAILAAGLVYAALMWTSNLVALVFTPALAVYVAVLVVWQAANDRRPQTADGSLRSAISGRRCLLLGLVRRSVAPAIALGLGLGLSAAFFVPALLEQGYINQTQWFGEYYDPTQHFVFFNQLFNPSWGYGISQPGPDDVAAGSLSYQLGAAPVIFSLVALALAGRFNRSRRRELRFWGLWAAGSIFLTLGMSAWAWRYVPLVPFAQFPWRYLMLAILPLSILPGALVGVGEQGMESGDWALGSRDSGLGNGLGMAVLLSGLLLLSSYPYFRVEMREPTTEQGPVSYAALMRFQRTSDEMTGVTAWVDPAERPMWSPMADEWVAGREVITRVDYSTVPQNRTLAVNAEEMGSAHDKIWYFAEGPGQRITFNRFWYPGWTAYLLDGRDGKPVETLPIEREDGPLARIVLPVPAGEGFILLRFEDTPLRAAAKWVTIGTIALVVLAAVGQGIWQRRARARTRQAHTISIEDSLHQP